MDRAGQVVRISAKPVFLFRNLLQYLESRRIVVPGYSFLQDVVSQALAAERARLTAVLEARLNKTMVEALDALYVERDGMYAITPLKHDLKDFSLRETKLKIARSQSLATLYATTKALLPELGISNDSLAYYAALVDYYTVQKLQQLPAGMARLYIIVCFLGQRHRQINDNLVNGLIYHVRKVNTAAKEWMGQQVLAFQREGNDSGERYVDSRRLRRNVQRAPNRCESYHKLVRAVAYANAGRLRVRTDLEQQFWSECSRLLSNRGIYNNACILSQVLDYAERTKNFKLADRMKPISPVSWKHVNFSGKYTIRDPGEVVDLDQMVSRLVTLEWDSANVKEPS